MPARFPSRLLLSRPVLLVLLLTLCPPAQAQCRSRCRFFICRPDGSQRPSGARIILRGGGYTRTGVLCRSFRGGRKLGTIRRTRPALVETGRRTTLPINRFLPDGLDTPFPPNYFRIVAQEFIPKRQGIARRPPTGNQENFLDGLCVRIPIVAYDILKENGDVFRSIATSDPRDCVSFATIVRPIVVDLAWDSSDDFDLSVEGPPGSDGKRITDDGVALCDQVPSGKEEFAFSNMVPGVYTVTITHFKNCFNKRTKWVLNVVVYGRRIIRRRGRSNVNDKVILEFTFTV